MSKNTKIIIGIAVILGALSLIIGLVLFGGGLFFARSASDSSAQYFMTVNEVIDQQAELTGRQIRISGAVIGESIEYDPTSGELSFLIANVPSDYAQVEQQGGLASVLENAVNDPNSQTIQIDYVGVKPELLQNMAQAIVIGQLHSDGIFHADEILLKCPSRYEVDVPNQVIENP